MAEYQGTLPLSAVTGFWRADLEHLKTDARKLPKELTMFLVCKLNLLTTAIGDNENIEHHHLHALNLLFHDGFIDKQTFLRILQFLQAERGTMFFGRAHCFEMLKYLSLWGKDSDEPLREFRTLNVQRALMRMIVTAFEYHATKTQLFHITDEAIKLEGNLCWLPVFRSLSLEAHSTTPVFSCLGRGPLFLDKYFFDKNPEYLRVFETKTGMSLQEYRDCALNLVALVLSTRPADVGSINQAYEYSVDEVCKSVPQKANLMQKYLRLEAASPSFLRESFQASADSGLIDFRVFRPRPILRSDIDGRFTVIDLSLLAERATYGPFFHARSGKAFKDFGDAFELYLQDEIDNSHIELGTSQAPLRNVNPRNLRGEKSLELADSALCFNDSVVLFQIKGSWLNEDHISLTSKAYWAEIQKKYCESQADGGKQKGIAQLGLSIKGMIDQETFCEEIQLTPQKRIFPVLLAHDVHLSIELFSYYFAREFCKIFGKDEVPVDGWLEYKGYKICTAVVMTLDDLELIECLKEQNIEKLLNAYTEWDKMRKEGFRNFMVNHWQRYVGTTSLYTSNSARAGLEYVANMIERWFSKADADKHKEVMKSKIADAF